MIAKIARIHVIGAMALVSTAFSGCLKPEDFPDKPILTFKELQQVYEPNGPTDTTRNWYFYLTVDFTDGDGDIGLDEADTQSPFGLNEAHYFNYFTQIRKRTNGQWADFGQQWTYRMKRITPTGQDPTLNGEIELRMGPIAGVQPFPLPSLYPGDTIEVTARLEDRSLNMSNTVTTGEFVKQ